MRPTGRGVALALLLPAALLLAQCKKQEAPRASPDCCEIVPAAGLAAGTGSLIVEFPGGMRPHATKIAVLVETKEVKAAFGGLRTALPAGVYDIFISGRTLAGAPVQAGHETRVKVGVLRVTASVHTKSEILDAGKVVASGHGNFVYGLLPGVYRVKVSGEEKAVTIAAGAVSDF